MKKLSELIPCDYDTLIASIEEDSRVRADNYLFCCIKGFTVDGHKYVNQAVDNGAVAILSEEELDVDVPVVKVKDTNKAMIEVLSRFFNEVDKKMKLIGVTGTDGKTTTTSIIYQLINSVSKCGYIGTNGIECDGYSKETHLTTPPPKEMFEALDNFYKNDCEYVAMEVSSEGLRAKRLESMSFDIAVFTNLTKDHINNHGTYENYRECKGKLFAMIKKDGYAIINNDDENADYFKNLSTGKIITYGIDTEADFRAKDIIVSSRRLIFNLETPIGEFTIESPLSGRYNVYNITSAIASLYALGFDISSLIECIGNLKPIKGRANIINYNDRFNAIIDYAHTANALKNILEYARVMTNGSIITVTGSAGGRDKVKRPEMGKIVTSLSDYVIFTMDDPRREDPNDIIDDMVSELNADIYNYERIIDRSKAIKRALSIARNGDVVLIAGRGNDTFMPIGDEFIRCNDYEEVYKNLKDEVTIDC
jgi:UDP-N-acetylmuramoyl-L-alanyl-D-glutamate--2,6-diaminopimelate ligase